MDYRQQCLLSGARVCVIRNDRPPLITEIDIVAPRGRGWVVVLKSGESFKIDVTGRTKEPDTEIFLNLARAFDQARRIPE